MVIHYFVEYTLADTIYQYRIDCGYDINVVESIIYNHLKAGDQNLSIIPVLEEPDDSNKELDIDNKIIDIEA